VYREWTIPDEWIQFEPTPQDKGVQCTLKLTRYDKESGTQWKINGKPIGTGLDVAWVVAATLEAMEQESARR
jgi:hypothetical protein